MTKAVQWHLNIQLVKQTYSTLQNMEDNTWKQWNAFCLYIHMHRILVWVKKKNRNPHAHSKIKAYAVIYFYKYSPSMRQKEVQSAANEVLIDPEAGYMYTCVTIFNT